MKAREPLSHFLQKISPVFLSSVQSFVREMTPDQALRKCSHLRFYLSHDSTRGNLVELGGITGKLCCPVLCCSLPSFHHLCLAQVSFCFSCGLIPAFKRLHEFPTSHLTFYRERAGIIPVSFSHNGPAASALVHCPWR